MWKKAFLLVIIYCCHFLKAFLRMLSENAGNQQEQRRLQELCSKEGAADYNQYIRKQHLSLYDILQAFPSCLPPLERVLENLTRLLPRPYSIARYLMRKRLSQCFQVFIICWISFFKLKVFIWVRPIHSVSSYAHWHEKLHIKWMSKISWCCWKCTSRNGKTLSWTHPEL